MILDQLDFCLSNMREYVVIICKQGRFYPYVMDRVSSTTPKISF